MSKKQETIKFLKDRIDECDELIADISYLRYRLENMLTLIPPGPNKAAVKPRRKKAAA